MYIVLERSRMHSVASAVRDAVIVDVCRTWREACDAAEWYADDCLAACAVNTETGQVYLSSGAGCALSWIHKPDPAFGGVSASGYLERKGEKYV